MERLEFKKADKLDVMKAVELAMNEMLKDGVVSYSLSRYAGDREVNESLVFNGFGIRCADAIQSLDYFMNNSGNSATDTIVYEELQKEDYDFVLALDKGLSEHLLAAPICYPTHLEGAFPDHKVRTNTKMFVAKDRSRNKIIGFLRVSDDGETVFTEMPLIQNISGTYIDPAYRNHRIAEGLLYYAAMQLYL